MPTIKQITIDNTTYELEPSKGQRVYVGTCSTTAATNPKVCTVEDFPVDGNGKPYAGIEIIVKFTATNTSTSTTPQLNVNGTGAIRIWYNNAVLASAKSAYAGYANRYLHYVYDGTYWVFMGHSVDNNSTYSAMSDAEITAGTSTTARLMTPARLRSHFYTEDEVNALLNDKQATLVSGTNLKTINNESLLGSGNITIESSSPTNIEYNSSKTALVIGGGSTKYTIYLYDGDMLYPSVKINDFTYSASRFPLEVNSGDILNVVVSIPTGSCTTTMGGTIVSTSKSFSIQSVSGNIEIKVTGPGGGPSGPGGDGPGIVIDP